MNPVLEKHWALWSDAATASCSRVVASRPALAAANRGDRFRVESAPNRERHLPTAHDM